MRGTTHLVGGAVAGVLAVHLTAAPLTFIAASAFGGLVPDWDHPRSLLGRWIPWPTVAHSRGPQAPPAVGRWGWPHKIWHRHQAHSLVGITIATILLTAAWGLACPLFPWHGAPWFDLAAGLELGALSHLFLDGFNQERQWWAWPLSRKGWRWPLHARVHVADTLAFWGLIGILCVTQWTWIAQTLAHPPI